MSSAAWSLGFLHKVSSSTTHQASSCQCLRGRWQISVDVVDLLFEAPWHAGAAVGGSEEIRNVAMINDQLNYQLLGILLLWQCIHGLYRAAPRCSVHTSGLCGCSMLKCPMNKNLNTIRMQNDPFCIAAAFDWPAYFMGRVPTQRHWKDLRMHWYVIFVSISPSLPYGTT